MSRRQGYHDTERALDAVREAIVSADALRHSQDIMLDSLRLLEEATTDIDPPT